MTYFGLFNDSTQFSLKKDVWINDTHALAESKLLQNLSF